MQQGDHVAVKYVGKLLDGTTFDASANHPEMGPTFNYQQGVTDLIPGWTEGTSTMKVGGKRKLIIPPQLGYGLQGAGDAIPPNATLIFEIELVAIQNPQYLAVAGAIVSVEGRHAATLRSLLIGDGVAFAGPDIIDGNGLDRALPPSKVLAQAAVYVLTPFTAKLLP